LITPAELQKYIEVMNAFGVQAICLEEGTTKITVSGVFKPQVPDPKNQENEDEGDFLDGLRRE